MPLINVHMAEGRSLEQKKALMSAITDAVVDSIGASRESVRVWIDEFPADHYMAAGELLSERNAAKG
jgi:4-oxalocrotonate tautomerase